MYKTTVATLMKYLNDFFFYYLKDEDHDLRDTNSVVGRKYKHIFFADSEYIFQKMSDKDSKLVLPSISVSLTQFDLPHGPSKPTGFRVYDNTSGTKGQVLNAKPANLTFSCTHYCSDIEDHFNFIQSYCDLQTQSQITVYYYINDGDPIPLELDLNSFESPTVPPNGDARSQHHEGGGLLYTIDFGFSCRSLFLESSEKKLIRCIRYDYEIDNDTHCLVELNNVCRPQTTRIPLNPNVEFTPQGHSRSERVIEGLDDVKKEKFMEFGRFQRW